MGAPKKENPRDKHIPPTRVTGDEKDLIDLGARHAGKRLSEFVRESALNQAKIVISAYRVGEEDMLP